VVTIDALTIATVTIATVTIATVTIAAMTTVVMTIASIALVTIAPIYADSQSEVCRRCWIYFSTSYIEIEVTRFEVRRVSQLEQNRV
jgi:hypothetical protein